MILETKKLFFRKTFVFSSPDVFIDLCKSGRYSSVVALCYDKLPEDFVKMYSAKNLKIRILISN